MSELVTAAIIAAAASVSTTLLQLLSHRKQSHIRAKVDATHHQVAVNNHSSLSPTLLDKLDELSVAVAALDARMDTHEELHIREREKDVS